MSKATVAAFLKRMRETPIMRQEMARLANRYGYHVSADELADVELRTTNAVGQPDAPNTIDDEPTDPGFGIIEVPA
jgi:hypothetical protein